MAKWRCKNCAPNSLEWDERDPDLLIRISRHDKGRHIRHQTNSERYPGSIAPPPMGNLTYAEPVWEKIE